MLDQLNFALIISFLKDIISEDKINIYSKIFIVDNTIPELMLVLQLFHLYVFNLWWFEALFCVFKPHFISYSENISHLFHTEKLSWFLRIFSQTALDFQIFFLKGYLFHY